MRKKILQITILLFLTSTLCTATITDIYSDATIGTGDSYDTVNIYDSLDVPPVQTTVDMTGGQISGLYIHDTSQFNLSGGIIDNVIRTYDNSILNVYDGSLPQLITLQNFSRLNLSGGVFNTTFIGASDQSEIHLYGYGFVFTEYLPDHISVEGYWGNNASFEFVLYRTEYPSSYVVLHEIPEPCTLGLFGFGFLLVRKTVKTLRN